MTWFQQAAKNPKIALEHPFIERIKQEPRLLALAKEQQLLGVALYPQTPRWLLECIADLGASLGWTGVGWLLHLNPQLKDQQQQLKQKFAVGGLELALDQESPAWLLGRLAKMPELRAAVALNSATPTKVLQRLGASKKPEVRRGVALNPAAHQTMLQHLAKDKEWTVRLGVAENQATPEGLLQMLQNDPHPQVALRAEESLSRLEQKHVVETPSRTQEKNGRIERRFTGLQKGAPS